MISNFKKIVSSVKNKGVDNTAKKINDKLKFVYRCKITAINLGLRRRVAKSALVISHGKYKFNFYGGGDRNEVLYHAFWNKMFFDEIDKIKDFINKGDTVLDVGGNLGFFVLILNELVGDKGNIYSFEPSKLLNHKLESTIKINNLKNVTLVNFALGESEGSSILHYNPEQSGLSSIVSEFESNSLSEEIKITTLDKFASNLNGKVSFIKIDTEGYEPRVLRGAKELIERDKPNIYIELGGDHQQTSAESLKILKEFNYTCEAENLDLSRIPAGVNYIATPK